MQPKERMYIYLKPDVAATIREMADNQDDYISTIAEELITLGLSLKRGEIIEQQSLPVIRDIVQSEIRKGFAQQRIDLREDMNTEVVTEMRAVHRASDNRLAALIVRAIRDSSIARRLIYVVLSRAHGTDFAMKAYEDAKEKTGKELANRTTKEESDA
jgi:hypothetical protein